MSWGAVRAVAAAELRRRWRGLVAAGLLAGFVAAAVTGALVTARRTGTAYDRLLAATAVGDALVTAFGPDGWLAEGIAALPAVEDAWVGGQAVARVEGPGVVYLGVRTGSDRPTDLVRPVVLDGRLPDPAEPDEVAVVEDVAAALGLAPGDELGLAFLTPEEVGQFDVGFGEPDGPRRTMAVTGVVRLPGTAGSPVLATPAFHERDGDAVVAATLVAVRLRDGDAGLPAFRAAVEELAAGTATVEGAEEFVPVEVQDPTAGRERVDATAGVLVGGLAVLAAVGAAAGLVALVQALARHHEAGAAEQRVEAALGLTPGERVLARVAAAGVAAAIAGVGAAAGGVTAGALEPLGAVAGVEPSPGFAPNVAAAALGAVAAAAVVLAAAAATAAAAARIGAAPRHPALRPMDRAGATAPLAAGLALRRGRSGVAGAVVGVAGVVAAATFSASLDRLVASPARWGWDGDVAVIDANRSVVEELLADERVGGLTVLRSTTVRLDGEDVTARAPVTVRPGIELTVVDGRLPTSAGEVAVGTRTGPEVGDRVTASAPDGGTVALDIVGVVVLPPVTGEELGTAVALTPEGLARAGLAQPFEEALIEAAPGADAGALVDDLASRYEVAVRELPAELDDLDQLGALPELLGAALAGVGVAALGHSVAATVRRRGRDLAVLRALGGTPGQVRAAVAVGAVATAVVGIAAGLPTGWASGRLVWWVVATAAGVAPDVRTPVAVLAAVAVAVPVVALLAAAPAARRAGRLSPAALLRAE